MDVHPLSDKKNAPDWSIPFPNFLGIAQEQTPSHNPNKNAPKFYCWWIFPSTKIEKKIQVSAALNKFQRRSGKAWLLGPRFGGADCPSSWN